MSKGITYFKLKSPYAEDFTKNCTLTGQEVDSNFFVLEGRDIVSITVNGDKLIINLKNGEYISSDDIYEKFTKDLSFSFDATKGVLYITRNGVTQEITGFSTAYTTRDAVAVDGTVIGIGNTEKPIGISPMHKTGMYRPVKSLIKLNEGETLPCANKVMPGDRYVTCENISDFGMLYDYSGVKKIMCDLAATNSGWRVPTKEDWDSMLDAVEPCLEYRTHTSTTANKYLGKFAGKILKSGYIWKLEGCPTGDEMTCIDYSSCDCDDSCTNPACGTPGGIQYNTPLYPNRGIDKYGFGILPAGYADDGEQYGYYQERAWFWTATNKQITNAYTKRFEYNKSSVYQDITPTSYHLSLRLVKDYNGDNFNEREDILGEPYSTVMLPSKTGRQIWTATNVAFANQCYNPMAPNDGQNVASTTTSYFLNEWDGKRWLRNELKEGETVVIFNAPNGDVNAEYRVTKGELVNSSDNVYENLLEKVSPMIEAVQENLDNEIERATAKETELATAITTETERATAKETEIENSVTEVNTSLTETKEALDKTNETVSTINTTLAEFGEETSKAIETLNTNLVDAINTINGGIATEIDERKAADTELSEKIEDLSESTSGSIEELKTALETEASERKAADEEISNQLIVGTGSNYNSETGVLTLKTQGEENDDIEIQFTFNFGTI